MNSSQRYCGLAGLVLLVLGCGSVRPAAAQSQAATAGPVSPASPPAVLAQHGLVVSVNPEASDAGKSILEAGGNAVDAAVTVALALAVTFPEAGNISGGGFMMVWPGPQAPNSAPVCVEYRETCPAALGRDAFVDEKRQEGHHTVAVPGTVRGLALAHAKYGSRPWRELVQPAIRLARDGFLIDAHLARELNTLLKKTSGFPEFRRVFGTQDGTDWKPGDRLVQPDLGDTLEILAMHGPDDFYTGAIARSLVEEMQRGGGVISMADLNSYRAHLREPVHTNYRGYDVYAPPPPSAGGTQLVECLNVLEQFDLAKWGRFDVRTIHVLAEAMRRAGADRARYQGDPAFTEIPVKLTSKRYAAELARSIDLQKATPSAEVAPDVTLSAESPSTTHFSVIDPQGMAVANTYTLQNSWGSRVVVRGRGFLLNNEMTDFNWKPGVTTRGGQVGTEANIMAPGKRMVSSQCPTLVSRDGKLILVTGSPGGRTIPSTVLCVVTNVLDFGLPIREAVDAPRWHHQWFPDRLNFERLGDPDYASLVAALRERRHEVGNNVVRLGDGYRRQGDAHSIEIRGKFRTGAADWRRTTGKASGW